jgi:hypothetical protein
MLSSITAAPPTALTWHTPWAGSHPTTACPRTVSSHSTTTRTPKATTASTLQPRCTTSNDRTALVPWTTATRCVDKKCGLSTNLRKVALRPRITLERPLPPPRLQPEANLESSQDPNFELAGSSRRGQATQLACMSHQTNLFFLTAVEFYRQTKLPDYTPKVALPDWTGVAG